jgi:hypothetical protein
MDFRPMSTHSTTGGSAVSLTARALGPVTDAQTYRNLLYLFVRFPLGIAYFTVLVTGIALGVGLTPLVVGVPILAGVLAGVTYLASFEALLARRLLGVDASYDPLDPADLPLLDYLRAATTDGRNYLLVAAFLASFPLGIAAFTAIVSLTALSAVLILAPVLYPLPFTQYRLGAVDALGLEPVVVIDTVPEALLASLLGIALVILSLHLCNAAARGLGRAVAVLCAQNR